MHLIYLLNLYALAILKLISVSLVACITSFFYGIDAQVVNEKIISNFVLG